MSISRAELESMDRDELIETIVSLSNSVEDLEMRLDAASGWLDSAEDKMEAIIDQNQQLRAENQDLRERIEDVESKAEQAMAVTSGGVDDDRSKTEVAKALTRNELVVALTRNENNSNVRLSIPDVQEKARPEHDLAWSIVDRAWGQLREEWPQFQDGSKSGNKAIVLPRVGVTKALARTVEADLGRTDLAKQFVGDETEGGRSE